MGSSTYNVMQFWNFKSFESPPSHNLEPLSNMTSQNFNTTTRNTAIVLNNSLSANLTVLILRLIYTYIYLVQGQTYWPNRIKISV